MEAALTIDAVGPRLTQTERNSFPWAHPWRTGRQVRRATARRAMHSRAVRQANDTRFGQSIGTANGYEKERSDALISKSESGMLGVGADRSRGSMRTQSRAPATAHTRTAQPQAACCEHPWPADGSRRRSATRPPTTHDPALVPAARLFCSTGASRDTALEREASVTVVKNTNEYL